MIFRISEENRFQLSSTSKGNQIKWFYNDTYLKADSMGYESIAEALVSELLGYCRDVSYADYKLCTIYEDDREYFGCFSENFLAPGESIISVYRLLQMKYSDSELRHLFSRNCGKALYDFVVTEIEDVVNFDVNTYFGKTLCLDAIVLNEDRHLNNLAVIKCADGSFRECPIYDNGLSLLSDTGMYFRNVVSDMRRVKAKPFVRDFLKQASYSGYILKIDYEGFCNGLSIISRVTFKMKEFVKAKNVLLFRLKELEGKVWTRV